MSTNDIHVLDILKILEYNPDTGEFKWKKTRSRSAKKGQIAGYLRPDGYISIMAYRKRLLAHRLAWLCTTGEWPTGEIDHINRNRADNRIENLRDVPRILNTHNMGSRKGSSSAHVGVCWDTAGNKWKARIRRKGKVYHLGMFDTEEEAGKAYALASKKYEKGVDFSKGIL